MNKREIIEKVKSLNLPNNSYVVFGNCPMAVAGIRESNDVDLLSCPSKYIPLTREREE